MEELQAQQIFEAAKSDNLKSFEAAILNETDLKIRFGRFPLLSVLYLFKSYNILNKFEIKLAKLKEFDVQFEYFEIYKKFKSYAGRSIRFLLEKEVIYPIEILAVMDERSLLVINYKLLFKNDKIIENIKKIYNLDDDLSLGATTAGIEIDKKPLTHSQKTFVGIIMAVFAFIFAINLVFTIVLAAVNGLGISSSPIKLSTEQEFKSALFGNKNYVLTNDLIITSESSTDEFSGTIDGANHTVRIIGDNVKAFTKKLSGTIKNLKVIIDAEVLIISNSLSVFAENNIGNIVSCEVSGDLELIFSNTEDDTYFSSFAYSNAGTIDDCISSVKVSATNSQENNSFVSGIAGENIGTISNCTNKGTFVADTVDLAGIVVDNSGLVSKCKNLASIKQDSLKQWNPNCAGISISNHGDIEKCINEATIESNSSLQTPITADIYNELTVYSAGIVCENTGRIKSCKNNGEIFASSIVAVVYSAGISAINAVEQISYTTAQIGIISDCLSSGKINAKTDLSEIYAGGISSFNAANILNSGFVGEMEINSNQNEGYYVFAGGICGYDGIIEIASKPFLGVIVNCYSSVKFETSIISKKSTTIFTGIASMYAQVSPITGQVGDFVRTYVFSNFTVSDSSFEMAIAGILGGSSIQDVSNFGCTIVDSLNDVPYKLTVWDNGRDYEEFI